MNWQDRARRELREPARQRPADTAETPPTAVMAVRDPAGVAELADELREAWEERSAILEFDNGLTRAEAERIAWLSIYGSARLHSGGQMLTSRVDIAASMRITPGGYGCEPRERTLMVRQMITA